MARPTKPGWHELPVDTPAWWDEPHGDRDDHFLWRQSAVVSILLDSVPHPFAPGRDQSVGLGEDPVAVDLELISRRTPLRSPPALASIAGSRLRLEIQHVAMIT